MDSAAPATADKTAAQLEFLAKISHELRTPLNGIVGYTDLLTATPLAEEQKRYVDQIHFCAGTLSRLVKDLLDLARIDSGKFTIERSAFALPPLLDNLLQLIEPELKRKSLAFDLKLSADMPVQIISDPHRVQQIISNLLTNAVDFTQNGSITLKVGFEPVTTDGGILKITLSDTGIGIPEEKKATLFTAFSAGTPTQQRRFGGTGLGLCVVKQIVDMLHGDISFESEEGIGTRFDVTFPVSIPDHKKQDDNESMAVDSIAVMTLPPSRFLVVEDSPINQEIIAAMLKKGGHDVDIAQTSAAALAALSANPYDVVLMDVNLPDGSGFDLCDQIRMTPALRAADMPIIAITAETSPTMIARCYEVGMNDYLSKPFTMSELYQRLSHWMKPMDFGAASTMPQAPACASGDGASPPPYIDQETQKMFSDLLGGKKFMDIIADFCRDFEQDLPALLDPYDTNALAARLHALASISGNLGFALLSSECRRILSSIRDDNHIPNLADLHKIVDIYHRTLVLMQRSANT